MRLSAWEQRQLDCQSSRSLDRIQSQPAIARGEQPLSRRARKTIADQMRAASTRPGDEAAIVAFETGMDYSAALVFCNMD